MQEPDYTDDQLIDMIRNGDDVSRKKALCQIYLSGYKLAKARILSKGGMRDEAGDAINNAIIILDNHIRNFNYENKAPIKNYFIGICYWQWLSTKGKNDRIDPSGDKAIPEMADFKTPGVLMLEAERKELVQKALSQLGDPCKRALMLYGLSHSLDEIAAELRIGYHYAKQMLFRCRKKLWTLLAGEI